VLIAVSSSSSSSSSSSWNAQELGGHVWAINDAIIQFDGRTYDVAAFIELLNTKWNVYDDRYEPHKMNTTRVFGSSIHLACLLVILCCNSSRNAGG
jgi:hypothetical protein